MISLQHPIFFKQFPISFLTYLDFCFHIPNNLLKFRFIPDASNNETTQSISFENFVWYHVRLRVTSDRIMVWLDDEEIINVNTTGEKISIRSELDLSRPLGIATWNTIGAVRNIYIRSLD